MTAAHLVPRKFCENPKVWLFAWRTKVTKSKQPYLHRRSSMALRWADYSLMNYRGYPSLPASLPDPSCPSHLSLGRCGLSRSRLLDGSQSQFSRTATPDLLSCHLVLPM